MDQSAAGQHRLVGAGLLARRLQLGPVVRVARRRCRSGSSQDSKEPSSRTRSSSSWAVQRWVTAGPVVQPGPDRVAVLVQQGRWQVVAPGHLVAVGGEEPQRRPGQGQRPEGAVLDVDQQALAGGLVPLVDLVEGAHLARRARRRRRAGPAAARPPSPRSRLDDLDHPGRGSPPARCWSPSPRRPGRARTPRRAVATGPRCRPRSGPRRRGSGTGRRARWTGGGCPGPGRPRPRPSTGCPGSACTPTTAASSEVRTTVPRPVRCRSCSAARTP